MIRRYALPLMLTLIAPAIAADRHSRVEGRLFLSPVGEPFRSDRNGDPPAAWFAGADRDGDGRLSRAEFEADALRWFAVVDRGHDGEIDPNDIDWYENELEPEIRVIDAPRGSGTPSAGGGSGRGRSGPGGGGGRTGGGADGPGGAMGGGGFGGGHHGGQRGASGDDARDDRSRPATAGATRQGAARFSYLDLPEPLTAADTNGNRGIDKFELLRAADDRFTLLDKNADGYLDKRELPGSTPARPAPDRTRPAPAPSAAPMTIANSAEAIASRTSHPAVAGRGRRRDRAPGKWNDRRRRPAFPCHPKRL